MFKKKKINNKQILKISQRQWFRGRIPLTVPRDQLLPFPSQVWNWSHLTCILTFRLVVPPFRVGSAPVRYSFVFLRYTLTSFAASTSTESSDQRTAARSWHPQPWLRQSSSAGQSSSTWSTSSTRCSHRRQDALWIHPLFDLLAKSNAWLMRKRNTCTESEVKI